jgi:hypothetical protein
MANYLVVTFSDRIQAEAAYTDLEAKNFPLAHVKIVGLGYRSLAEANLFDPSQAARQQMLMMMFWLVPFGFFAGFTFNQVTGITILEWLSPLGNSVVGGLMGGVAGAMGSITVGGGMQLLLAGKERTTYKQRLRAGKYLLVIVGSETLVREANQILRSLPSEVWQMYEAPEPLPKLVAN